MKHEIAIVYHTVEGSTGLLAQAISDGVITQKECESQLFRISENDIVKGRYVNTAVFSRLKKAQAIIFGSPTYMGNTSAQFKAFADASSDFWLDQQWVDKLAAGFTVGANPSGDQLSTIQYMAVLAAQHGMLWCGLDLPRESKFKHLNRLGAQSGLITCSAGCDSGTLNPIDRETAQYFGGRVAEQVLRLHG